MDKIRKRASASLGASAPRRRGKLRRTPLLRPIAAAVLTVLALGATLPAVAEPPEPADLLGTWEGELPVGDVTLRLVFHLRQSDEDEEEVTATIDSPDQGAEGIPVERVVLDGETVRLEVDVLGAVYEGRVDTEAGSWTGEWRQSGNVLPLTMRRDSEPAAE